MGKIRRRRTEEEGMGEEKHLKGRRERVLEN